MKKFSFIAFILFILTSVLTSSASETKYGNLITEETTIEDDFKLLNLNIEEYYKPTRYDYEKWYVVAMSEGYVDVDSFDIQTYFYLYNPTRYDELDYMSNVVSFVLTCSLKGKEQKASGMMLKYDSKHCLYKVKGFTYSYAEKAEIAVTKVKHNNLRGLGIESTSEFKAAATHSKLNNTFGVELNFHTTLIIDEYSVVEIEVHQDDNFINNWNSFWSNGETTMLVYFYNFNFPNDIKPDLVEYAKFQYDYLTYHKVQYWFPGFGDDEFKLTNSEKVISEYTNKSRKLRVNNYSQELDFPTFYLGNRIKDKQFGSLKVSLSEASFDYDCSVLLDSTYKTTQNISGQLLGVGSNVGEKSDYTILDKIEMLELHYRKDGVLYKCQVASKPVDKDEFEHGTATPDKDFWGWLWEMMIMIGGEIITIFFSIFNISMFVPELAKGIVGVIIAVIIVIIAVLVIIPALIKGLIKLVFSIFTGR